SITQERLAPLLPYWNKIFLISCVFAVLFDPLFFYTPVTNEDAKCLRLDKKLKIATTILRSITDLFYLVDILIQIDRLNATLEISTNGQTFRFKRVKSAKRIFLSCIVTDIAAVLPLPQVVIFIFFSKIMRGSASFTRMFLNALVLLQYVPRVIRIYLSGTSLNIQTRIGIWIQAVFNFLPFILSGHILGAIWYFFAIQREIACWEHGCRSEDGCNVSSFDCDDNGTRNITNLDILCPINPSNETLLFDFGVFLGAVQSGMMGSTNFSQKLLQCFWWGLRNLSSLGSNLEPSSSQWENIFAVFIFLSGMMLFLIYLSATLQTLSVQLDTIRSDELKLRQKMQLISPEIDLWLYKNDLPKDLDVVVGKTVKTLKMVIIDNIQRKLQENKDVDVENVLSILPLRQRRCILSLLRLTALKKVPLFEDMDEKVLNAICAHLKPVIYAEDSYILQEGEPLEKMLFITQGTAWSYTTISETSTGYSNTKCLGKGDLYGEELLSWALKSTPFSELPISTRIVRSQTKVEAFAIRAKDLKNVIAKFWWHFRRPDQLRYLEGFQLEHGEHWKHLAVSSIQANWRHYCALAKRRELREWRKKFITIE
ncbi:cyclic nucleotide-gated ion channel 1-like, partial [Rosa rugosa]|uniref:cyclic nucleotide-gated ion channel 1-like n=1 Tax=Rosa rugosa TaxID=74645 RepID=UPI002B4078D5